MVIPMVMNSAMVIPSLPLEKKIDGPWRDISVPISLKPLGSLLFLKPCYSLLTRLGAFNPNLLSSIVTSCLQSKSIVCSPPCYCPPSLFTDFTYNTSAHDARDSLMLLILMDEGKFRFQSLILTLIWSCRNVGEEEEAECHFPSWMNDNRAMAHFRRPVPISVCAAKPSGSLHSHHFSMFDVSKSTVRGSAMAME
ncbi:hypothetical protein L2E82_27287 [Cichorium intybus]|uniref:Uncharacterized protein n=1 Tax=Cichorium intybus TaxID=13427 RepID=A0ACB9CSQ4_CICIN|nr:hypothetical protein L2E82_27287 [Cichorium intybus]